MQIIKLKVGDQLPIAVATVKDSDGNAVDVSGYTIKFSMCTNDGDRTAKITEQDGSLYTDGTDGKVQYEWTASDTDTAGDYLAEFVLTSSGKRYSLPKEDTLLVQIRSQIA